MTGLLLLAYLLLGLPQFYLACQLSESPIPPWVDSYGSAPNITIKLSFNRTLLRSNCQRFTLNQTHTAPSVQIFGPDFLPDAGYTFIIVDPDAFNPARPLIRNVVHWIVSNIPGSKLSSQDVTEVGTLVLHYLSPKRPAAPPPYGVHRYYSLLFKQNSRYQNIQNITTPSPALFSVRAFTDKHTLGYPVAGAVFEVDLDL